MIKFKEILRIGIIVISAYLVVILLILGLENYLDVRVYKDWNLGTKCTEIYNPGEVLRISGINGVRYLTIVDRTRVKECKNQHDIYRYYCSDSLGRVNFLSKTKSDTIYTYRFDPVKIHREDIVYNKDIVGFVFKE